MRSRGPVRSTCSSTTWSSSPPARRSRRCSGRRRCASWSGWRSRAVARRAPSGTTSRAATSSSAPCGIPICARRCAGPTKRSAGPPRRCSSASKPGAAARRKQERDPRSGLCWRRRSPTSRRRAWRTSAPSCVTGRARSKSRRRSRRRCSRARSGRLRSFSVSKPASTGRTDGSPSPATGRRRR